MISRTLYILYRIFACLIRTSASTIIRIELSFSRARFFVDNHSYNVSVTAHAFLIIFFFLIPVLISRFRN